MSILRDLCQLLLQSGCRPQRVVSSLAFYPPDPPSYSLERARVNVLDSLRPVPTQGSQGQATSAAGGGAARSSPSIPAPPPGQGMALGGTYEFRVDGSIPRAPWPVHLTLITEIVTRRRKRIPAFLWAYPGAKYTLLFSHGNGVDVGLMQETLVHCVANLRVNVVAYDYTGYGAGRKAGPPTEADVYADITAVLDWCCRSGQAWGCTGPQDIILYGQSLGTAATLYAACRAPVRAVILHSPMTSGLRIFMQNRACLAPCDAFNNLSRLTALQAGAVLILHGQEDDVIPVQHGERVLHALPRRYARVPCMSPPPRDGTPFVQAWFPANSGHADLEHREREAYITRCRHFLSCLSPGVPYHDYVHAPVLGETGVTRLVASGVLLSSENVPEPPGRRTIENAPAGAWAGQPRTAHAPSIDGDSSGIGSPVLTPLPLPLPLPVPATVSSSGPNAPTDQASRARSKSALDTAATVLGSALASIGSSAPSSADAHRARIGSVAAESLPVPHATAKPTSFLSVPAIQQAAPLSPPSWPAASSVSGAAKDSSETTRTRTGSVLAQVQRTQGVQDWAGGMASPEAAPASVAVDWAAKVRMEGTCADGPSSRPAGLATYQHAANSRRGRRATRRRRSKERGLSNESSDEDEGRSDAVAPPRRRSSSKRKRKSKQEPGQGQVQLCTADGTAAGTDSSSGISDADA